MLDLPTDRPARILLVRLSHLGDALHALPVYHALREGHPTAEIWWAIQPEFGGFLTNLPGLAGVVPYHRRDGLRGWLRLRGELRKKSFDCAINAQGNWKSAAVAKLSGAPIRWANAKVDWRETSAAVWANRFADPARGPHAMHRMQALCDAVGSTSPMRWDLPLTDDELREGQARLAILLPEGFPSQSCTSPRPGTRVRGPWNPTRTWLAPSQTPVNTFSACRDLRSGKRAPRWPIGWHSGQRFPDLVGQTGLRQLAGLLSAAAIRGMRMLATDSGPCHMASAVGLPVDLLAGPTYPDRTGPWPTSLPNRCLQNLETRSMASLDPAQVHDWLRAFPGS